MALLRSSRLTATISQTPILRRRLAGVVGVVTLTMVATLMPPASGPAVAALADGTATEPTSTTSTAGWGMNFYGQLGNARMVRDGCECERLPVQMLAPAPSALAGGDYHTLALDYGGTVWASGRGGSGALGNGSTEDRSTPTQVSNLTAVTAIAAGDHFSLAVEAGNVWAFGTNGRGQLGNATTDAYSTVPVQLTGLADVVSVAGGEYHGLALKSDGTVWAWGSNGNGQLGDGTTTGPRRDPVQVKDLAAASGYLTDVVAIAAGVLTSYALKSDGTVWAWGYNYSGQIGDGTTTTTGCYCKTTAMQVKDLVGVKKISAGDVHALALTSNPADVVEGAVYAWGANLNEQLGDGTTTSRSSPVLVQNLSSITDIAGGGVHSLALKSDGTAWAWGHNLKSQLGIGTTTQPHEVVQVQKLSGVTKIGAGDSHSLAVGIIEVVAPTGVSARAGDEQVQLSWDGVAGASGYYVKRSTTAGGPYSTVGSVATPGYTDAGLANGTTYYYVVSALSGSAESADSAQVDATPARNLPAVSRNLLVNPEFDVGMSGWTFSVGTGSSATGGVSAAVVNRLSGPRAFKAEVTEVDLINGEGVELSQPVSLAYGKSYRLGLVARAPLASDTTPVRMTLQLTDGVAGSSPTQVYWSKRVELREGQSMLLQPQSYLSSVTDPNALLRVFFHTGGSRVLVDRAVLTEGADVPADPAGLLTNPEFDSGTAGWALGLSNGAKANAAVVSPGGLIGANALRVDLVNLGKGKAQANVRVEQALSLSAGSAYELSFMTNAEDPKPVTVRVVDGAGATIWSQVLDLPDAPGLFGPYTFTSASTTAAGKLIFEVGGNRIPVTLDNVVLTPFVDAYVPSGGVAEPPLPADLSVPDASNVKRWQACANNALISLLSAKMLRKVGWVAAAAQAQGVCGASVLQEGTINDARSSAVAKCLNSALANEILAIGAPLREWTTYAARPFMGCASGTIFGTIITPATAEPEDWGEYISGLGKNVGMQTGLAVAVERGLSHLARACGNTSQTPLSVKAAIATTGIGSFNNYITTTKIKGSDFDPSVLNVWAIPSDAAVVVGYYVIRTKGTAGPTNTDTTPATDGTCHTIETGPDAIPAGEPAETSPYPQKDLFEQMIGTEPYAPAKTGDWCYATVSAGYCLPKDTETSEPPLAGTP